MPIVKRNVGTPGVVGRQDLLNDLKNIEYTTVFESPS